MPLPTGGMSNDETIRLGLDVDSSSVDPATASVKKLGEAMGDAGKHTADFGRTALESGRILQDFSQGGIAGILNNIEGFTRAMGGGPGAAGIMTAFGLAVYFATPYVKQFWKEMTDGANEVPKSTDAVQALGDELKKTKDRLEELAKQTKLSNTELAEWNRLTAAQKVLEEDLDVARERIKQKKDAREKLARSAGAVEAEAAKERAENLGITLGGSQQELEVDLFRNLGAQGLAAEAQLMDEISRTPPGEARDSLLRQLTRIKRASAAGPNRLANIRDLMGGAIGQGNLQDIQALQRLLPKGSKFRGAFQAVSPEAMEAADREEQEAVDFGERAHAGAAKFRRAYAKRIDQDKLSERLTEEGRHTEAQMWEEKAREDERDKHKRDHDAEKAARENDPTNRLAARIKAREDAATIEAERQNDMRQKAGAAPFSDAQLRSIASEAASLPGDLAGNVDFAMGQAVQKLMQMMQHIQGVNARLQGWGQTIHGLPQMGESRIQ